MVHALKKTRNLLNPGGVVLNVHDLPDPPRIDVYTGGRASGAGRMLSHTDFEMQRQADDALAQAVEDGLFTKEEEQIFEYTIHADTYDALKECLAESWETAYLPEETTKQVNSLMSRAGEQAKILMRLSARITRLKPV